MSDFLNRQVWPRTSALTLLDRRRFLERLFGDWAMIGVGVHGLLLVQPRHGARLLPQDPA